MTHTQFMQNISQAVELGSRFTVNFEKRTLRLNRELVSLDDVNVLPLNESVMLREIEGYYQQYKYSIPSERSQSHRRSYFKALPEEQLSDQDMLYGVSREVARCQLEVFVLLMLYDGQLRWHNKWGSWFWQSPNDKDLIILRSWVEPQSSEPSPNLKEA